MMTVNSQNLSDRLSGLYCHSNIFALLQTENTDIRCKQKLKYTDFHICIANDMAENLGKNPDVEIWKMG